MLKKWSQFNSDVKRRFMYQNRPSKSHQLPFDQVVQIVIPPRSLASVPELIGTPFDGILHRSEWPGFVVDCINYVRLLAAGDKNGSAVTLLSNVSTTFTEVYFCERILRTLRLNKAGWSKIVILLLYFLKISNFAYFFFEI